MRGREVDNLPLFLKAPRAVQEPQRAPMLVAIAPSSGGYGVQLCSAGCHGDGDLGRAQQRGVQMVPLLEFLDDGSFRNVIGFDTPERLARTDQKVGRRRELVEGRCPRAYS